jgi:hypothetical protein
MQKPAAAEYSRCIATLLRLHPEDTMKPNSHAEQGSTYCLSFVDHR